MPNVINRALIIFSHNNIFRQINRTQRCCNFFLGAEWFWLILLDTGDENDCIQFKKRTPGSTGPPPLRRDLVFRLDRNFTPWHGRTPPADGPTAAECRWGCRGGGSERASCNLESQISMGHSKISARRESRYHERTHEPFARKWQLPMPSSSHHHLGWNQETCSWNEHQNPLYRASRSNIKWESRDFKVWTGWDVITHRFFPSRIRRKYGYFKSHNSEINKENVHM